MLTPNPQNRPDIFEVEDLLETWDDHDHIVLNPDAQKLKDEENRKLGNKVEKASSSSSSGKTQKDLTPDEIRAFQKKLQMKKLEDEKKYQVPLHSDYNKKMEQELYNKQQAKDQPKKTAKADNFDWDDFGSSGKNQIYKF
jgi:hypothetical protein